MKIICVWSNGSSGTGTLIKGTDGSALLYDIGGDTNVNLTDFFAISPAPR